MCTRKLHEFEGMKIPGMYSCIYIQVHMYNCIYIQVDMYNCIYIQVHMYNCIYIQVHMYLKLLPQLNKLLQLNCSFLFRILQNNLSCVHYNMLVQNLSSV